MTKPILCLDFDGVIHSYTSGWHGADIVKDPPVPGAMAFIKQATQTFRVMVYSSRSGQKGGIEAMRAYIRRHAAAFDPGECRKEQPWYSIIEYPTEKPSAMVTLDDRAITFTGTWPSVESLIKFKPWNKK